ncbi:hypothetical protein [Flavobacterium sp.]|uniref:hypothetical protein n=1 Tax=Flavobacterium sp. TaxID=239 RepID=UPI0035AF60C7
MEIQETKQVINVYIPFKGGVIHGFGIVRNVKQDEHSKYSKVFENKSGRIFFDTFQDRQIRGIKEVREIV